MGDVQKIRTACRSCHGGCGVIAHVKNGKVIKVEGDPDSPISHGSLCSKGLAAIQLAYHPERILYPLKKTAGKWSRISWEEALDTIAAKFEAVIKAHGPEAMPGRAMFSLNEQRRSTECRWSGAHFDAVGIKELGRSNRGPGRSQDTPVTSQQDVASRRPFSLATRAIGCSFSVA